MTTPNPLIDATIYVWGEALDPANVTALLGIEPSVSRRKGTKRLAPTGREIVAKTSVWTLSPQTKSENLSDHVQELASMVDERLSQLSGVPGFEGAYVDIFVAVGTNEAGDGRYVFNLTQQDIAALQRLGLRVEFTIDIGKD